MNTYTIYFNIIPVIRISDTRHAYAWYRIARAVAKLFKRTADMVWNVTGEIVEHYAPADMD